MWKSTQRRLRGRAGYLTFPEGLGAGALSVSLPWWTELHGGGQWGSWHTLQLRSQAGNGELFVVGLERK